jgi:hypothetical protein
MSMPGGPNSRIGRSTRLDEALFFRIHRRELRDPAKQGIHSRAHLGFIRPLAMKSFLQHVHGFEAKVHDGRRRLDFAVPQPSNQILDAMGNPAEPLQSNLRGRAFHRMNGAKQLIDLFRIVVAFERN